MKDTLPECKDCIVKDIWCDICALSKELEEETKYGTFSEFVLEEN